MRTAASSTFPASGARSLPGPARGPAALRGASGACAESGSSRRALSAWTGPGRLNDILIGIKFAFSFLDTLKVSRVTIFGKRITRFREGTGYPEYLHVSKITDSEFSNIYLHLSLVPDLSPALGVMPSPLCKWGKNRLMNVRERKVGLKRTCAFSLPLPSTGDMDLTGVQPTCSSRWCKRVERFPRQGISYSAFKDVRIRQLIFTFHVTDLRRLELEGSSQALLGLNCFCFAFPTTSPIPATIHGSTLWQFKDTPLRACWWQMDSYLCFFHFPPALCPLASPKLHFSLMIALWIKPSRHVKLTTLFWSFLKILKISMEETLSHLPSLTATTFKKTSQWQNLKP